MDYRDPTDDLVDADLAAMLQLRHSILASSNDLIHLPTNGIAHRLDGLQPGHLVAYGRFARLEIFLPFEQMLPIGLEGLHEGRQRGVEVWEQDGVEV